MALYSQETEKIIINEIRKLQSSQEGAPVNRKVLNEENNHLQLNVQENKPHNRKSFDTHKVFEKSGIRTIFLNKDKVITIKLSYSRAVTGQLWVRLYPITTSNECPNTPVVCCAEHQRQILFKHTTNNNSIVELNDPSVVYEKVSLLGGESQISARVRYFNPELSIHLAFKCYNTCIEVFKRHLPRLMFSIESYNEDREEYVVLGESFVQFKVCASPARDFKTEVVFSKRKSMCLKTMVNENSQNVPQRSENGISFDDNQYFIRVLDGDELKVLEAVRDFKKVNCSPRSSVIDGLEEVCHSKFSKLSRTELVKYVLKTEPLEHN